MKKILLTLVAVLAVVGLNAQEVTVADGITTSEHLPIYGFYGDTGFENEFIYPASLLADLEDTKIQSVLFYSAKESAAFPDGEVTIRLSEVNYTTLSDLVDASAFTVVYKGAFNVVNGALEFAFTTPFEYKGGNLLVDIKLSKLSSKCPATSFYGIASSGNGYNGYTSGGVSMGYVRDFLPKATFSYEVQGGGTCANPTKVKGAATPDGGVFTWSGAEGVKHQYCVVAHDAEPAGWKDIDANVFTCTVTGLNAGTNYDFCLRADCGSEQSAVVRFAFTPVCNAPANLKVTEVSSSTASFAWDAVAGISQFQFVCVEEGEVPAWDGVEAKEGLTASLTNLDANTSYDFYVRSFFSASTQSEAVKVSFTTECDAKELPFREAFSADELPACWEVINHSSNGWQLFTGESDMSGNCIRFNARGNGVTKDTLLLPIVNLSEPAEMKLIVQNISGLTVKLHIIKANGEIAEVKDFSAKVENPSEEVVDLTAFSGKVTLFFEATQVANRSSYFYLDNLQIKKSENSEAIDNTNAAQTATKQIINGQLYIIRENGIYDARGTQIR